MVDRTGDNGPFVVAIGASAGGVDALRNFFASMPVETGLAFIVANHTGKQHPTMLPEILGHVTAMEVVLAEDDMVLQSNRVHVIPSNCIMTVDGYRARLREPQLPEERYHVIDTLFASIAKELEDKAIGVILSGSGNDGTYGAVAIKDAGGHVFVQDEGSARFSSMPHSVNAAGAANGSVGIERMPDLIMEAANKPAHFPQPSKDYLERIFPLLEKSTNNDFSSYKTATIMRRIERRMIANNVDSLDDYVRFLEGNPAEVKALSDDILIGVTSFFRDPMAFEVLKEQVFPQLLRIRGEQEPLRIWNPCCSTGEEVYSIAIAIQEYLVEHELSVPVQIFATDIDEAAIAQARAGRYPENCCTQLSEERLGRFFVKSGVFFQVAKPLRDMVIFAHHNLITDPPFSRLDLLVCRNFFIYLQNEMQKRLIPMFHQLLKQGGVLFLGGSESIDSGSELFAPIDKKWKIYKRLDVLPSQPVYFPRSTKSSRQGIFQVRENVEFPDLGPLVENILLERYAPACIIVNEKFEMVYISTNTRDFLVFPRGTPTKNILKVAREELRPAIRASIHKALNDQQKVNFRSQRVGSHGQIFRFDVVAEPINIPAAPRLAMVLFEQVREQVSSSEIKASHEDPDQDESSKDVLIRQLEDQLHMTNDQLMETVWQLESSNESLMSSNEELLSINEEYQSTNEELQSTNEELETSKEELQALNEEMASVNAELQLKVEELNRSNSDLENLFRSSAIATIFLDTRLNIKRYTPAMAEIYNLIPSDIGRPFHHISGTLDLSTMAGDVDALLAGEECIERELMSRDESTCYMMRVMPYRDQNREITGVIVVLIDITERKLSEDLLREQAQLLDQAQVLVRDLDGRIMLWNSGAEALYGFSREEALGQVSHELLRTTFPKAIEEIQRDFFLEGTWNGELVHRCSNGEYITVSSLWKLYRDAKGKPKCVIENNVDVTERRELESQLRQAQKLESLGRLAGGVAHDLNNVLQIILGNASLLRNKLTERREAALPQLDSILEAVKRGADLIRDLLAFGRKQTMNLAVQDLNRVVSSSFELARRLVAENVRLTLELEASQLPVNIDEHLIQQVLFNLVTNARDAVSEQGAIGVKTFLQEVAAWEGVTLPAFPAQPAPGLYAGISVRDNGSGIPEEVVPRIFEPFYTTKEQGKGTGLGLPMVVGTISQLNGCILVDSGPGRGSEFRILLPISDESVLQSTDKGHLSSQMQLQSGTVLIAEDEDTLREMLEASLTAVGYNVVAAKNGRQAVEIFRNSRDEIDIVILDAVMPEMNGSEALRLMTELRPGIPHLFLSGYGYDVLTASGVGSEHVIVNKPVGIHKLIESIRAQLGGADN